MRLALRHLLRRPAYAMTVVLTLALGIGANTGAFSAAWCLLLRPLPYSRPGQLVALYETTTDHNPRGVGLSNLLDWRARATHFDGMAAYRLRSFGFSTTGEGTLAVIQTGMVTADFFPVLRQPIAFGRIFTEDEEVRLAPVAIITYRLWRQYLGADPAALGRTIYLNEEPRTVVGVLPPEFEFPIEGEAPDVWFPLSRTDYTGRLGQLDVLARLKPGASMEGGRSELASLAAALALEYPRTNQGRSAGLQSLDDALRGHRRRPLLLLLAAAGALLLIACANVAGLTLARLVARRHEVAVRASLGASFRGVAGEFFAEGVWLAAAGGAAGWLCASALLDIVPGAPPLERAALAFTAAVAAGVTLLLGLAPALAAGRTDLMGLIRGGSPGIAGSHARLRDGLVVGQIALSVMLLLSAGLLLRTFYRLVATDPGFETANALRFGIGLPDKRYRTEQSAIDFHRRLLERLNALPGVEAAGLAGRLPLRGGSIGVGGSFQIAGSNIPIPQRPRAWVNTASPEYFRAMRIPLLQGRPFAWQDDRPGATRVAIVNQAFQKAYLQEREALGTPLDVRWITELNPDGSIWQIVGVVGDTRQATLDREAVPEIFLPVTQVGLDGGVYVVRHRGGEPALVRAIPKEVAALDPWLESIHPAPLAGVVERNLGIRRLALLLTGIFGAIALALTAVGIYGAVAFRASQRRREMAIRLALGARPFDVTRLVLTHGLGLAAGGVGLGVPIFVLSGGLLRSQLYGVTPADPVTWSTVAAGVELVALAASLAPSRRAARTAPIELLRDG